MLFHAFLREPGTHTRSRDTKGRINALGTNIRFICIIAIYIHFDVMEYM